MPSRANDGLPRGQDSAAPCLSSSAADEPMRRPGATSNLEDAIDALSQAYITALLTVAETQGIPLVSNNTAAPVDSPTAGAQCEITDSNCRYQDSFSMLNRSYDDPYSSPINRNSAHSHIPPPPKLPIIPHRHRVAHTDPEGGDTPMGMRALTSKSSSAAYPGFYVSSSSAGGQCSPSNTWAGAGVGRKSAHTLVRDGDSGRSAAKPGGGVSFQKIQCFKTKQCRFWLDGRCTRGDDCTFAHFNNELRDKPDLTKTKICAKWRAGQCLKSPNDCTYAHGLEELRQVVEGSSNGSFPGSNSDMDLGLAASMRNGRLSNLAVAITTTQGGSSSASESTPMSAMESMSEELLLQKLAALTIRKSPM